MTYDTVMKSTNASVAPLMKGQGSNAPLCSAALWCPWSLACAVLVATSLLKLHCHATRSATRGAYFWQMAHTKYGKRSLRHLGPKIWDKIDPSLHDSSHSHLKNSTEMYLSLPMMTDSMVLKHEFFMSTVYHFILPTAHFNFKLYISLWTYSLLP